MEQTVLRPKPMPGQGPAESETTEPGVRRPHAAPRRRGRRLTTLLCALLAGAVLVLSGVGLGTLGATVIGMSRLAELQKQARPGAPASPATSAHSRSSTPPSATPSPAVVATLGVEAVDDRRGAQVVGVHVPGARVLGRPGQGRCAPRVREDPPRLRRRPRASRRPLPSGRPGHPDGAPSRRRPPAADGGARRRHLSA